MELLSVYKCAKCGNMVEVLHVGGGPLSCCGEPMQLLTENTTDAAKEKHVPVAEGINVKDLVAYGRFPYQKPLSGLKKEDHEIIDWAMRRTGVYELRDRRVDELSGGQRQRVWIALTLAQKTDTMIFDEPTTYLDISHQIEVLELLRRLNREDGATIVVVIHELNHAAKYADHIIGMKAGQIQFEGAPNDVVTEANLRTLYDIDAEIMRDPARGYPVCVDYSRTEA